MENRSFIRRSLIMLAKVIHTVKSHSVWELATFVDNNQSPSRILGSERNSVNAREGVINMAHNYVLNVSTCPRPKQGHGKEMAEGCLPPSCPFAEREYLVIRHFLCSNKPMRFARRSASAGD